MYCLYNNAVPPTKAAEPPIRITQAEYDNKKDEINETEHKIKSRIKAHTQADASFADTVESLLTLMSRAGELFESSKVEQKHALLKLVCSNCELKNKKLVYSIRKPFNILMELNGCQSWLGQLDSLGLHVRGAFVTI